ncbi:large subunit ribosomal protein L40 [Microdochium nivale]|nr:large subunit ribosomal protein L40 [Microdochium nivale]
MASTSTTRSLTGLLSRLSIHPTMTSSPCATVALRSPPASATTFTTRTQQRRSISTTTALGATNRGGGGGGKTSKKSKKGKGDEPDQRIVNLKTSMPRVVPSPLRFGRNRYLRHWTIHRAWLLLQRQQREAKEKELGRMYQSMRNACEELRNTSGPGLRDEGYLYRVALGKQGIYGRASIPIEYARLQTETPPRVAWNHEWKR